MSIKHRTIFGLLLGIYGLMANLQAADTIVNATGRAEVSEKTVTTEDVALAEERAKLYSRIYGDGWRDRRKRIAAEKAALFNQTGTASDQEKRIAVHNACIQAVKSYVANLGTNDNTKSLYDIIATRGLLPVFIEGVADIVPDYRIIKESRENGLLVIEIAAKINVSEVYRIIKKATESATDATQKSSLVFVMIAREVASVDEGHAVTTAKSKATENKSETVNVDEEAGEGKQTSEEAKEEKSTKYDTAVQERIAYRFYDIGEVQSRILKTFNQDDIEVLKLQDLLDAVDAEAADDAGADVKEEDPIRGLSNSFATGQGLAGRLKKLKAVIVGFECEWFAVAQMTVGRAGTDPDTGQSMVEVTLNMDVGRLVTKKLGAKTLKFYKNIASDVQSFKGFGQDPAAAKVNGLLRAGNAAATGIVGQMRDKLSQ